MPKIIENLEEKIFNVALELFGHYGYKNTDMKKISKKVGIAVGTLYNYYPNKRKLFTDILKKSWEETFVKLDKVINCKISSREKLKNFINVLYEDIRDRKGLVNELIKEDVLKKGDSNNYFIVIKQEIFKRIDSILNDLKKEQEVNIEESIKKRLFQTLFIDVTSILDEYPDEEEENIKFLNYIIDCTVTK